MSMLGSIWGPVAVGIDDQDYALSVASPVDVLNSVENGAETAIYLVELSPWDSSAGAITHLYYSNADFGTANGAPAEFEVTVAAAYTIQAALFVSQDGTATVSGNSTPSAGAIELDDSTGDLDALLSYDWDSRDVTIRVGFAGYTYDQFATVFVGTASSVRLSRGGTGTDAIFVDLKDLRFKLRGEIQSTLYAGTGGVEGGDDLKGKPKPKGYGQNRQVPAPLVDSTNLVYQLNDGAIQAVDAIRDRGVALAFDADYASYAALVAATIPAGEYGTCLAEGLFRLGAKPDGKVTSDFRGDNAGSLGYVSDVSGIVRKIVTTQGSLVEAGLDLGSFTDFAAEQPAVVHVWTGTEERQIASVLDDLLTSAGGLWGFTRTGLLRIKRINNPTSETAVATLGTGGKNINSQYDGPWEIESLSLPSHTVRVGFKRYLATLSSDEVAGAIDAGARADFGEEYRFEPAEDSAAVLQRNPTAKILRLDSSFDASADAAAEAARLLAIYKIPRQTIRCQAFQVLLQFELGDVVSVVNPRYGLSGGKNFTIIGFSEDASWSSGHPGIVGLTLWG